MDVTLDMIRDDIIEIKRDVRDISARINTLPCAGMKERVAKIESSINGGKENKKDISERRRFIVTVLSVGLVLISMLVACLTAYIKLVK